MQKNLLPSRQFIIRVLIIIILALVVFSVYKIVKLIKNRNNKDNSSNLITVIKNVVDDGNDNDIPDWEERLWGLNPNKNGKENKEYIMAKRKALNPNSDFSSEEEPISPNENLNREFFAIVMSLQQTGNLDDAAIQAISDAYSQKIDAEPINDTYTIDMLKVVPDSAENSAKYYDSLQNLILKYQDRDIGAELGLIVQGIAYNDPQVLFAAQTIATSYREFGQDLIKIPTTESLSLIHLSIANNYEKSALTVYGMTQLFDDPIAAMKSIINYKKYNDELNVGLALLLSVYNTE